MKKNLEESDEKILKNEENKIKFNLNEKEIEISFQKIKFEDSPSHKIKFKGQKISHLFDFEEIIYEDIKNKKKVFKKKNGKKL
jgi:hypothetical protein